MEQKTALPYQSCPVPKHIQSFSVSYCKCVYCVLERESARWTFCYIVWTFYYIVWTLYHVFVFKEGKLHAERYTILFEPYTIFLEP